DPTYPWSFRTPKSRRHPPLVGVKEVSVCRSDMQLRRGKRAAEQDLLIDEPLVVVFVKLGFESRIRHVVGSGPLPNVANHLLAAVSVRAFRKGADGCR